MGRSQIPRLVLSGAPEARGRRYGALAADRIAVSLASYRTMFETCGISWSQAQRRASAFAGEMERGFPTALAELEGVAHGSGVPIASLLALNARTELLPADYLSRAGGSPGSTITECTSFAAVGAESDVWLAQNWDWIGSQRAALVLLDVRPDDGPRFMTLAEAGMMAKVGMNEYGFGITLNILRSVEDGRRLGMPTHVLLRALLDCRDVAEARAFAAAQRYSASSNVLMADAGGAIASLEHSPRGASFIGAREFGGRPGLCHTNHFLHPDQRGLEADLDANLSTVPRLEAAIELLGAGPMTRERAQALLSDTRDGLNSICRFPDPKLPAAARVETVASVVMNLTQRRMWVSPEQPTVSEYVESQLPSRAEERV